MLRNMRFVKKHSKKGLKKMLANNTKAMSTRVEAIKVLVKFKVVKLKMQSQPSCFPYANLVWEAD